MVVQTIYTMKNLRKEFNEALANSSRCVEPFFTDEIFKEIQKGFLTIEDGVYMMEGITYCQLHEMEEELDRDIKSNREKYNS